MLDKLLLSELTHIFSELINNSNELKKNVGCTQAIAIGRFL